MFKTLTVLALCLLSLGCNSPKPNIIIENTNNPYTNWPLLDWSTNVLDISPRTNIINYEFK